MAIVTFAAEDRSIEVPDGTRLQDAIARAEAEIDFGCREGECATCIIEVIEGIEHLGPPNSNEQLTLMEDEIERGIRLACQCKISSGRVVIRPADDSF